MKRGPSDVKAKQMITTTPSQQTRTPTTTPLLAICLGYFMTILDVTIVNVALVDFPGETSCSIGAASEQEAPKVAISLSSNHIYTLVFCPTCKMRGNADRNASLVIVQRLVARY